MKKTSISVGVVSAGSFAQSFIPLFKAHPQVHEVVLADLDAEKLRATAERHQIARTYHSLDALCESDVDAVAIMTQHWLHAPQAVQALQSGKHVYSAVPSAVAMEEMDNLVAAVERSNLVYMVGETSYYYPAAIYCRERHRRGEFGHIVYGEGEYFHDWDHNLYEIAQWRHGENWRRNSGDPPMYYPTHSTAMIMSVTGAHATHVSCHGFRDTRVEDQDIYYENNKWGNVFSNQTALLTMSDGSCARINEFRRIGHPEGVRMNLFGTEASFEQNAAGAMWLTKWENESQRLDDELRCCWYETDAQSLSDHDQWYGASHSLAPVHPAHLLPSSFAGLTNGHQGSHQFLVNDFVLACCYEKLPPNNVWQAARYLLPGLVAHESAQRGGVLLEVPDYGNAPDCGDVPDCGDAPGTKMHQDTITHRAMMD